MQLLITKTGVKHLMLEYFIYPVGHPLRGYVDETSENILLRLNSRPPQITEKEIRDNYSIFADNHDKTPDKKTGKAYAELLINAMNAGIKVHFAGDDKGGLESSALEKIGNERDEYLRKYAKLELSSQSLYRDTDFINKLDLPDKEKRALESRIFAHREKLGKISDRQEIANQAYQEARLGRTTEIGRGERFVSLAKGEKSLVVFGNDHFNNSFDLNEAIGQSSKRDGFKRGKIFQDEVPVIQIYADKNGRQQTMEWDKSSKMPIVDPAIRIYADTGEVEIPASMKETASFQTASQQAKIRQPTPTLEKQF